MGRKRNQLTIARETIIVSSVQIRRYFVCLCLWVLVAGMTCFGAGDAPRQNAGTIPTASDTGLVYTNLSVRVACWQGWNDEILHEKPFSGDRGPDGGWRYFDVKLSLKGLPVKQTASEFLDSISKRTGYRYTKELIGWLAILRWNEKDQKFLLVGRHIGPSKTVPAATIQEGDFLVFHGWAD